MLVVNLFGAPGSGKSTGAAHIFSELKILGINAELVTEVAKDKTWENNTVALADQSYIFGNQNYRLSRCKDKVDVVITDSPLPLSILYNNDSRLTENFNLSVMDVFNSYSNMNYLINRVKKYNPIGRNQNESESNELKDNLVHLLYCRSIPYKEVNGERAGYDRIVQEVLHELSSK